MSGIDVSKGKYDNILVVGDQMIKMTLYRVIIMVIMINMSGPSVILSIRFFQFN